MLAQRAKARGYEWLALEIDEVAYEGSRFWPAHRDACHFHGLVPGVWITDGWNLSMTPADAEFVIAEHESPGDHDGIVASPTPTIPHGIITNFSPFSDHGRDPGWLLAHGWVCITEAYLGSNPNATPDRMHARAQSYGWVNSQPAFGVYDAPLSAYDQWMQWPGCDYLAENTLAS